MLTLDLPRGSGPLEVLCLGSHSDDVEIGCGGALLKLVQQRPVSVTWVVFSASGVRVEEAKSSANQFLQGAANADVRVLSFRDGYFPFIGAEIKDYFETLKRSCSPQLIFTHTRDDRHQDHRLISDLTWTTFRNHMVLEYEIPKYDGDLGTPNAFVTLDKETCRRKVEMLTNVFQTQRNRHWFTEETFFGLMRLRGIECAAETGYAEAFYCRKAVLSL